MSELDRLRSLGDQVVPPSFELLRETARRGSRRDTVAGAVAAAVAVTAVASTTLLTGTEDRSVPDPAGQPNEVSTTHPLTYALGATITTATGRSRRPARSSSWT